MGVQIPPPPPTKYGAILCDPPWAYADKCNAGRRGACHKYETMTLDEIKAMRQMIDELAATDCVLFLWAPPPLVVQGVVGELMAAWGFTPKSKAFCWVKTYPTGRIADTRTRLALGMGHWTRANTEDCWLGVRGHPRRIDAGVMSTIISPRREHSRKPDEAYALIERLLGDVPRIELFARQRWPGWDSFGFETHKFTPQSAA